MKEFTVTADMVKTKNDGGAELIKLPTKEEKKEEPQIKPAEEIA